MDESTAFLSHWGPPPLRPTEESDAGPPATTGWTRPAPPSRLGAGRTADTPTAPPRPGPDWSRPGRPSAALPPVVGPPGPRAEPDLPAAPTEPAAERWIAERLAAGRSASASTGPAEGGFAGYWATGEPASDAPERPAPAQVTDGPAGRTVSRTPGRSDADGTAEPLTRGPRAAEDDAGGRARAARTDAPETHRPAEHTGADAFAGWAAARPGADERFAGYWATDPTAGEGPRREAGDRPGGGSAGPGQAQDGEERFADQRARDRQRTGDERTGNQRAAGRTGGDAAREERVAGQPAAGPERVGEERFAGYWTGDPAGREQRTGSRDEPTEVLGPFDVGAWSRDGAAAPARPRGRQRQAERPEPVAERPNDRAGTRSGPGPGGGPGGDPGGTGGGTGGGRGPGGRDGEPPKGGGSPQRKRRTFGDRIRTFVRGIGQLFITLGLVLLLLAVYEVWFTDLMNHRTQKNLATSLQNQWDNGDDPTVGTGPSRPGEKVRSIPLGEGFALIYIPDFGTDYVFTVVEGTGADQLNKGPGHYVGTALPGEVGNVAIAGHRVGKGSPFLNVDKLKAGSAIIIRTKSYWYTYRVVGGSGGNVDAVSVLGFPGREIVDPSDVGVVAPVPDKPGAKPTQRLLTLTTCHPKFTPRQRMVIHAELSGAPFPVSQGIPPSMTGA